MSSLRPIKDSVLMRLVPPGSDVLVMDQSSRAENVRRTTDHAIVVACGSGCAVVKNGDLVLVEHYYQKPRDGHLVEKESEILAVIEKGENNDEPTSA